MDAPTPLELESLAEEIGETESLLSLRDRLVQITRNLIDANGMCFVPFEHGVPFGLHGAFDHDQFSSQHMQEVSVAAYPITQRDVGGVTQIFEETKRRTVDLNAVLEPRGLHRTQIYNEYWRPHKLERQLLALQGEVRDPLGFICVSRSAHQRPFVRSDLDRLAWIRRITEPVLQRLLRGEEERASEVLAALTLNLPLSCALIDARGVVLWTSSLAEDELGVPHGVPISPENDTPAVREWRHAALLAITSKSEGLELDGLLVRKVRLGNAVLAAMVIRQHSRNAIRDFVHDLARKFALTRRESEVLTHVAAGATNKAIGTEMSCSPRTVEVHVASILRKTGCASRTELVARYFGGH